MEKDLKVCIGVLCYQEGKKFLNLLKLLDKIKLPYKFKILIVDDHSTDETPVILKKYIKKKHKFVLITHEKNYGIGKSIKDMISFCLKNNFKILTVMAGNGKDNPLQIPRLLDPIIKENYDYVQGSRFLKGGSYKNLPIPRMLLIKGFTLIMSLFTFRWLTDAANGFRAYKISIFKDKRININQDWLNQYEFETYLHYKVLTLGYKFKEVPVSKDYLKKIKKYSHIRPFLDWWKIIKPLFLLKLGLKK